MTMMMLRSLALAFLAALSLRSVTGFVTKPAKTQSSTALSVTTDNISKQTAASFLAAAYLVGSLATADVAVAFDGNDPHFGSSDIVAARSGGRAGGRSYRAPASSSRAPSTSRSYRSTTVIQRPIYATPPVVVSPFGYGYNPMGGFGLGYGLGAMGNIGNDIRDYRQEGEIQKTEIELEQSKAREAQLEQRIKALEEASAAAK